MKFLLAMVAMVLATGACIEEAERVPADYVDPATCGKCVQAWDTVYPEVNGFPVRCVQYSDGALCCPSQGDEGCPGALQGYEWATCSDVVESDGFRSCLDDDAESDACEAFDACD